MLRAAFSLPIAFCLALAACGGASSQQGSVDGVSPVVPPAASASSGSARDALSFVQFVDEQHVRLLRDVDALFCEACPAHPASARLVPNTERGALLGFRWHSVDADTLWWALGVRNGDVLVAIDGQPATAQTPAQLYDNLSAAGDISLTFMREGEPKTLRVEVVDRQ